MAKKQPEPLKPRPQYKLFNWLNRLLPLDRFFAETTKNGPNDTRIPVAYFNYFLWVILLLIVQGRIGYWDEVNARKTVLLSQRAENMRAEYTTLVSENMKSGKQSVVQTKLLKDSIMERKSPPVKIVVDNTPEE
ncbi:hypothetical protein GCM10023091_11660 [Ravibacter arvi]|uniref:S-adenosyl-methyltransferase n=1 Tax=Ravibacter arvi TaxID=2051041 RepID=A0ABP8LU02_9BACT